MRLVEVFEGVIVEHCLFAESYDAVSLRPSETLFILLVIWSVSPKGERYLRFDELGHPEDDVHRQTHPSDATLDPRFCAATCLRYPDLDPLLDLSGPSVVPGKPRTLAYVIPLIT